MEGETPSPGDVLIVPDATLGGGYALATAPDGLPQLWYPSYEQAALKALEWASESGVSAWHANGRSQFERVLPRGS